MCTRIDNRKIKGAANVIIYSIITISLLLNIIDLASAATENLILNPGFENGSPVPLNWTFVTNNGNIPAMDTISHSGGNAVKISTGGTKDIISGYPKSDLIQVEPLQYYNISAWGKTEGVGGTNRPVARFVQLDADKKFLSVTNLPEFDRGTNDWAQRTKNFQTRPDAAYLYVYANIWGGYGTLWLDDIMLSQISESSDEPVPIPSPSPTPTPTSTPIPPPISTPSQQALYYADFETGDRSQWDDACIVQSNRFQIVTSPVRQGSYAAKFVVNPGDECWSSGNERTELALYENKYVHESEGDEYYYGWSTLFPDDWTTVSAWGLFMQWHTPITGARPALSLYVNSNDGIFVGMCTGTTSSGCATTKDIEIINRLTKGKWNDFIVHVKWSSYSSGIVEIWHRLEGQTDYEKIFTLNNVPTLQTNSGYDTYISAKQQGLYRSSTSKTQTLYQDGLRIGKTFESVLY